MNDMGENITGGIIFGGIIGVLLNFAKCFCSGNWKFSWPMLIICVIIGCAGMCYFTYLEEKEKQEREAAILIEKNAKELAEAKEAAYQRWNHELCNSASKIIDNVNYVNEKFDFSLEYTIIKSFDKKYPRYKNCSGVLSELEPNDKLRYDKRYREVNRWLVNELNIIINKNLTKETGPYNCQVALLALKVLKIVMNNDANMDKVIDAISEFEESTYDDVLYLNYEGYGEIELLLDDPEEMEYYDSNIDSIVKSIKDRYAAVSANLSSYYSELVDNLNEELLIDVGAVLWYYAKKKPFDVNKYNEAKDLYNKYLNFNLSDKEACELSVKVEVVLSMIYAKNQMGGENLVRQDWPYINKWLEDKYINKWTDTCCLLASGLAWMELYNLEKEVLRKLVQLGCNLDEEMQERLNFLESGGTANIEIYDIPDDKYFYFDNSSVDWGQKEIDIFFRKIAMKNWYLEYSLLLDRWTKTIPLQKGQKIDSENIYKELKDMVDDFDGEVKLKKVNAKAINVKNIEYDESVLFEFTNKRNKCSSVLFSYEKYGRNLNLIIFTLFTPEDELSYDELKQYACSIKSNEYMDSFRESILQALDLALKEKKTVYDDGEDKEVPRKAFE